MTVTIPTPQRINNKLSEFYPLQKEELMKLYEVGLIKSAAYVHFALRLENPYCDRPVQVIPKEFALRWRIPEKSVYRAIARLKELGILNIKSGKLVIDWVKPEQQEVEEVEEVAVNENPTSKFSQRTSPHVVRKRSGDSQSCEKILRVEKKFSEVRKNSQSCETRGLKPLSDIGSESLQTSKTIQTNQTKRGQEKSFSQNQESDTQEAVQELVQKTEDEAKVDAGKQNESVGQSHRHVVQEKTKIISPRKSDATPRRRKTLWVAHQDSSSTSIPNDLKEKLEELEIPLDNQVRKAIASHHISQAYGAAAHVENTWDSINNPRGVFLFQLPKQPIEQLGSRYSQEILNNIRAQNQAIEEERKDPEYQKRSKELFAQVRAKLKERKNQ